MIIKNFKKLATTKTRKDALEIINAGIESVLVNNSIKDKIKVSKNTLTIQGNTWNLSNYKRIFVIGAGKASSEMAESIEKILGNKITSGLIIDTKSSKLKRIKSVIGTHPLPSEKNVKATNEIIQILKQANKNDLILALISGGGSALLCSPRIGLKKQIEITKLLLKRGANIQEINTIRKHTSYIKGGQLAYLASPARLITLIVSDVMTNDLEVIASGPTVLDSTTINDAIKIQKKYNLPKISFIETPKTKQTNVTNILLITNHDAVQAMEDKAQSLGYKSSIMTTQLVGEASQIGKSLAHTIRPNHALIAAGETTVNVRGNGKGGRNQELALSASQFIKSGVLISCSTDGVDFIKEAAGGIVDQYTNKLAIKNKLNAKKFLKNNDSYNFLRKVNGLIVTGKTGTNVSDIILALGDK